MKTKIILILIFTAIVAYFLVIHPTSQQPVPGQKALSFTLPSRKGAVSLRDFSGKVVLLNFWATWCPPCVEEMPSLERLYQSMGGEDFQIVAISEDEEGWAAIDPFLGKIPLTLPILWDVKGEVANDYGASYLPQSYLIDKDGMIVQVYSGGRNWTDHRIMTEIESYVQKKTKIE